VRGAHDARRTVHRDAEEIAVAPFGNAGVQAATDTQGETPSGLAIGKRTLELDSGGDGVSRIAEYRVHTVTRHLDDDPAISLHGRTNNSVMASDGLPHARWLNFPKGGTSLNIREEKGKNLGVLVRPHRNSPQHRCCRKQIIVS
jgi:hypothetical protein